MPGECSVCLSSFKEPVSIPCGHIYCTKCLADLANAPNNESMKASCPTCRAQFNLLIPDLTYLPKKYHEFVMPSVRRVYLDSPRHSELKRELKSLKEKVKKLEKDNDILMRQCERHMAAALAQAEGEKAARQKASVLQSRLCNMEQELQAADVNAGEAIRILECDIHATRERCQTSEKAYDDLRRRYEKLKARQYQSNVSISITQEQCRDEHSLSRRSRRHSDLRVLARVPSASRVEPARDVLPLGTQTVQPKSKARPASPLPACASKRQRLSPASYIGSGSSIQN